MKKLLALVLALMLALGCAAAVAEEAAPAYGLDTKLQLTLNHDLGPMLAGMITGNYDEKISEAVMDVLDSVYLDVACGGNVVDMALMGNDYPLTSVVGVADEAGQQRDEGAECGAEQRQHAVLDGDVRVGHGAGDRYEASADEEQCGTDGDGHDALYRCIFHKYHSFIVYFC